jgi:cytoskeletal protein CcmA (bactofilin family)
MKETFRSLIGARSPRPDADSAEELDVPADGQSPPRAVMSGGEQMVEGQRMGDDAVESVIGEGTTVEGTFRSEHPIRIHGTVQGEVESKHRVVIEAGAKVQAKVLAQEIVVRGEVNGELTGSGKVEITATGRVTGEISARAMVMDDGAYFQGHLEMPTTGAVRNGGRGPDALKPLVGTGSIWRSADSTSTRSDEPHNGGALETADLVGGEAGNGHQ